MVRLFNIYFPMRLLVLIGGESLIVCSSFLVAAFFRLGEDSSLVLTDQYGLYKILGVTALTLVSLDFFDLYDPQRVPSLGETYFRILVVLGLLSFLLAGVMYLFPNLALGNDAFVVGMFILTLTLLGWRSGYAWLIQKPYLRERAYVLGTGNRARFLVRTLREQHALGIDVVGWNGAADTGSWRRDELAKPLLELINNRQVDRVIVAFGDRRGTMPVRGLLEVRLRGIKVEDAGAILEKITGQIEVGELYPSWLIFSDGFRLNPTALLLRRIASVGVALVCLIFSLPLIPFIALAIKLTSPGPILYRQKRVGRNGEAFTIYKFRTMRFDAEASTGPTWASNDDPRVTRVGRWLRDTRLDEIPQLWNVLHGEMSFVGPRPERPEFVQWLSQEIPYYHVRHIIRPGITGWAQIRCQYGASLEDSKEKLKYDLYYVKNMSFSLDLIICLRSIKIVLLGRGAR